MSDIMIKKTYAGETIFVSSGALYWLNFLDSGNIERSEIPEGYTLEVDNIIRIREGGSHVEDRP